MQSMLKRQLQRAFEIGELGVHYQPKFHLDSGRLQGVEALLRWQTGNGRWIGPAIFVPLLEETGLIDDVGMWLFQRAAADVAYWRCRGQHIGHVAINVSPLQLRRAGFLDWVLSISSSWSEWGAALQLELTESAILAEPAAMVEPMNALAAADVLFALDDFGMGYSSFDLLMQVPASYLKIDRSFIARMLENPKAATLVEVLVRLAHQMELQAIAEGVETASQLARLQALGCDIGQGHYFTPALDRDGLLDYLALRHGRPGGERACSPGASEDHVDPGWKPFAGLTRPRGDERHVCG